MKKTILKQILITLYSDGTTKSTTFVPNFAKRGSDGRFGSGEKSWLAGVNCRATKTTKSKKRCADEAIRSERTHESSVPASQALLEAIPGLDANGNVTRRVTCPDCGLVFTRSFKILKEA